MKTIRATGLGLALCAGFAGIAQAQGQGKGQANGANLPELFARLDVNKDGVVTRSEIPERALPAFERLLKLGDSNKDGKLETDEMKAITKMMPAAPAPGRMAMRPGAGDGMARFKALDKDGDGKLSREEFPGRPQGFERLDVNKDGKLDPQELRAFAGLANAAKKAEAKPAAAATAPARVAAMEKDGEAKGGKAETAARPRIFDRVNFGGDEGLFGRLDLDGNGTIDKAEAAAAARAYPAAVRQMERDANGDGKLSRDELKETPERFDALDADMDGFVTFEEIVKSMPAQAGEGPAMEAPEPAKAKAKPAGKAGA